MTQHGGTSTYSYGTVFKIKPDGSGYLKLRDFAGGSDGSNPKGSLYYDGNFLYGMTYDGGIYQDGTIFKLKPDGTGYIKLKDFNQSTDGLLPYGSLISDGTYLYGTTAQGGTYNYGIVFKIKPDGSDFIKLMDFADNSTGEYPIGTLVSDGSSLYGMTMLGGTIGGYGSVFKIMPDGSGFSKLLDIDGTYNGSEPYGSLIVDSTFLYGMVTGGGTYNDGVIFKLGINPITGINELNCKLNMAVYPNPATNNLTIDSPAAINTRNPNHPRSINPTTTITARQNKH